MVVQDLGTTKLSCQRAGRTFHLPPVPPGVYPPYRRGVRSGDPCLDGYTIFTK
jgi:hypothetical protein